MLEPSNSGEPSTSGPTSRARGRGKSRGGLGKYLRARGRGRGLGRPAEFGKRLLLEGEGPTGDAEEDEEAAEEQARKFSRRQLGTNADRYAEPEPELNSDGEPELEPEVDLTLFLDKQRLSSIPSSALLSKLDDQEDEEVDHTLSHISSHRSSVAPSRKGKVEQIDWDIELDEMSREKAAAEATWDLKSRFRAKSEKMRQKPIIAGSSRDRKQGAAYIDAPPLPLQDGSSVPETKNEKEELQDFLDDLLI